MKELSEGLRAKRREEREGEGARSFAWVPASVGAWYKTEKGEEEKAVLAERKGGVSSAGAARSDVGSALDLPTAPGLQQLRTAS